MSRAFVLGFRLCGIISLLLAGIALPAQTAPQEKRVMRVLTIGNSFADNIATTLPQIADAAGYTLVLFKANIGSCSMEKHWKLADLHETNPTDPAGMPYTNPQTGKKEFGLKEALMLDKWDFVTIQQYSVLSEDIATYRPYARNLYDYIKQYAPQAEVLLYETWAYRSDDAKFKDGKQTPAGMYRALSNAYRTIAGELGVRMIPVGDAFYLASTNPNYTYTPDATFDFAQAKYPAVPDQTHSLHSGWHWQKDKTTGEYTKLGMDGHHASRAGCYLGGLVFFHRLTGQSVIGNPFKPKEMSDKDARTLQTIAEQAVRQREMEEQGK